MRLLLFYVLLFQCDEFLVWLKIVVFSGDLCVGIVVLFTNRNANQRFKCRQPRHTTLQLCGDCTHLAANSTCSTPSSSHAAPTASFFAADGSSSAAPEAADTIPSFRYELDSFLLNYKFANLPFSGGNAEAGYFSPPQTMIPAPPLPSNNSGPIFPAPPTIRWEKLKKKCQPLLAQFLAFLICPTAFKASLIFLALQ
jgi:hypothetical protein